MADIKRNVLNDIDMINSMTDLIIANEEIAANNMRRIREGVVGRRGFLTEITELYKEVRESYKDEVKRIINRRKKSKHPQETTLLKINAKTACVLITTNTTLYGDMVRNTYNLFKETVQLKNVDVVIVGKIGKRVFEEDNPGAPYAYFDIPDNIVDIDKSFLDSVVNHIIQYETVIVFHSKFETLARQTPVAFVISETQIGELDKKDKIRYIFEPSLEKVIEYFEKEIFGTIFENTMHESDLSKFSSHMVTLDKASENIKKSLSDLYSRRRYMHHQKLNKDQVNSVVGIMMSRGRPA